MLGSTNDTLFIEAVNLVLLGRGHVWFCEHWLSPRPTVKKNFLSTVLGRFAGNFAFAKLRIFLLKFVANIVSLNLGSDGFNRGSLVVLLFEDGWWYSRIAAVVVLSKVAGPVA